MASTSATRRALLERAGLPVETEAPDVDERALESAALAEGATPADVARRLARAKALAVSRRRPDRLVVGADQTLACNGELFHKPADAAEARMHLARLAGRAHDLHSAAALARGGEAIAAFAQDARLSMRPLSPAAIERYVAVAGSHVVRWGQPTLARTISARLRRVGRVGKGIKRDSGDAVVCGGYGLQRPPHLQPPLAQSLKSLRRGDFVHQM